MTQELSPRRPSPPLPLGPLVCGMMMLYAALAAVALARTPVQKPSLGAGVVMRADVTAVKCIKDWPFHPARMCDVEFSDGRKAVLSDVLFPLEASFSVSRSAAGAIDADIQSGAVDSDRARALQALNASLEQVVQRAAEQGGVGNSQIAG